MSVIDAWQLSVDAALATECFAKKKVQEVFVLITLKFSFMPAQQEILFPVNSTFGIWTTSSHFSISLFKFQMQPLATLIDSIACLKSLSFQ
jgi:hypothetical protein